MSSSSFGDLDDDNVDEFCSDENSNFTKIKNPSLMASIVNNSSRHYENAQYASSLLVPSTSSPFSSLLVPSGTGESKV